MQQRAISQIIKKRDVVVQAQSGTGKTATFCIGTLQLLDPTNKKTQALFLAPTRELASQIHQVRIPSVVFLPSFMFIELGGYGVGRPSLYKVYALLWWERHCNRNGKDVKPGLSDRRWYSWTHFGYFSAFSLLCYFLLKHLILQLYRFVLSLLFLFSSYWHWFACFSASFSYPYLFTSYRFLGIC